MYGFGSGDVGLYGFGGEVFYVLVAVMVAMACISEVVETCLASVVKVCILEVVAVVEARMASEAK